MADYSRMTNDDFRTILDDLVAHLGTAELMAIPGIYEILSEELNNEVLERWEQENPRLAYPEDYADETDDEE